MNEKTEEKKSERILNWDGCVNVRDLGGLMTYDGRLTRRGTIVRSDTPARLTAKGWEKLHGYGIRTIITLRTYGKTEEELDFTCPYEDIVTVQAVIEDITDQEFLQKWAVTDLWCTPLYYPDAILRWPKQHAAVITTMGQAHAGGILFHCIRGNDRTGIIALLLLRLAGVMPEEIAEDYEMSLDPYRDELLARNQSSTRKAIQGVFDGMDLESQLRMGGLSQANFEAVRKRLLG
jgi:protein-tyrosine phosphatase